MEAVLFIIGLVSIFVALDVMALRVGVDSRYESNDPHAPTAGLSV